MGKTDYYIGIYVHTYIHRC